MTEPNETNAPTETKRQRSKRVAEKKMDKLLDRCDKVKQLATPAYELTKPEYEKIVKTIHDAADEIKKCFETKRVVSARFSLSN